MIRIDASEVENEPAEKRKIMLTLQWDDIYFQATPYGVTVWCGCKEADTISFKLQSAIQDIERRKDLTKE